MLSWTFADLPAHRVLHTVRWLARQLAGRTLRRTLQAQSPFGLTRTAVAYLPSISDHTGRPA